MVNDFKAEEWKTGITSILTTAYIFYPIFFKVLLNSKTVSNYIVLFVFKYS